MSVNVHQIQPQILLAEDDLSLRELLSDILTKEGYIVDEAGTGEEALQKAAQNRYNAVILDLVYKNSPVQGLDVLKQLHANVPELPVIVMSGRASDEAVLQTIREGGFSFLIKPIHDIFNVLFLLEEAIEKDRLSNHLSGQLQQSEASALIKGVPVDIHIYLRQYLDCFEDYMLQVKGIETVVGFEGRFDDVYLSLQANAPQEQLYAWLEEFLSFAEQHGPLHLEYSTTIPLDEQLEFTKYLNNQIDRFTFNVSRALRRHYIDPMYQMPSEARILYLNPQKMLNQISLRSKQSDKQSLKIAVMDLTVQVQVLVDNNQTLLAINALQDFCEKYELKEFNAKITRIQRQFNQSINQQLNGLIDFPAFVGILSQIHHDLLNEILVGIEAFANKKRA